ncbi:uncharacterized protein LOC115670263 [Syzygium oleosum]|uniref:uncharacterized protein LOC115670263 n=1 Tax=Syzygium oleosum TaxID=219896 RepID=UPI0024BB5053|nr:uncharacterized protein LOC115670263 [Syzygium oleosum]
MESKKISRLLTLVFSLLMVEDPMASRVLAENRPTTVIGLVPYVGMNGSMPSRDKIASYPLDLGDVPMRPPATKTTMSQAGHPNTFASAVVSAPSNAKVNVPTAVSPNSATSKSSVTSAASGTGVTIPRHP